MLKLVTINIPDPILRIKRPNYLFIHYFSDKQINKQQQKNSKMKIQPTKEQEQHRKINKY